MLLMELKANLKIFEFLTICEYAPKECLCEMQSIICILSAQRIVHIVSSYIAKQTKLRSPFR